MKRSWLAWLGLLGFIGLIGTFAGNPSLSGFYGFFGFFAFSAIRHDERLGETIGLASRNAFVTGVVVFAVTVLSMTLVADAPIRWAAYGFAASFASQMLVFALSLGSELTLGLPASSFGRFWARES